MGGDRDLNIGQQEKWKKCVAGVESRVEKIITSNPDFCAGILSANGAGTFPAPKAGTMQRSGGGQRVRGGGKGSGGDSLRGNISDSGGSEWRESGAASVGGGSIRRQRSGGGGEGVELFQLVHVQPDDRVDSGSDIDSVAKHRGGLGLGVCGL